MKFENANSAIDLLFKNKTKILENAIELLPKTGLKNFEKKKTN